MKRLNWAILVFGIWIIVSPWILGFYSLSVATWSNVFSGVLIVVLSLWGLFGENSFDKI